MKELFNEYSEFVRKHTHLLIFNIVLVLLVFGVRFIGNTVFIDTDTMLVNQGTTMDWLPIGRWGLVITQYVLHLLHYNPYVSMGLAVIFILLFLETFCFFFQYVRNGKEYPCWLFCGLFISHPIFAFQWVFQLQNTEVAFSIFLTALSLILIFRWLFTGSRACLLFGILLMPWAFASYETNYVLFICGALAGFLMTDRVAKGRETRVFCIRLILAYAVGAAATFAVTNLFFLNRKINDAYGTFLWLKDAGKCVSNLKHYFKTVLTGGSGFYGIAFLVMLLAVILYAVLHTERIREMGAFRIFAFFMLLVSAFILPLITGQAATYRNQYNLPFVTSAVLAWLAGDFLAEWKSLPKGEHLSGVKWRQVRKGACVVLIGACLLAMLTQTETTLRLWYTDRIRYDQDCRMMDSVVDELRAEGINEKGQAIVFTGNWEAPLNPACYGAVESFGLSYFTLSAYINPFFYYSNANLAKFARIRGYEFADVSREQAADAAGIAASMPSWPEKGCIRQADGYIVVKLSDWQD